MWSIHYIPTLTSAAPPPDECLQQKGLLEFWICTTYETLYGYKLMIVFLTLAYFVEIMTMLNYYVFVLIFRFCLTAASYVMNNKLCLSCLVV